MDIMCEQFSKDKKQKKKVEKYRGLPNSLKNEFIQDYFHRCELKFNVKVALEMAEVHGGLSPKNSEMLGLWKAEIKNLEKKLGLKKDDKMSSGHLQKTGSAGGTKGGSKKDHKNDKKDEALHFMRDLSTYKTTPELINSVH